MVGLIWITTASLLLSAGWLGRPSFWQSPRQTQGVTFSWPHAEGIGLDWRKAYTATLNDLGVKHVRLPAYWNRIETRPNAYDFDALDWQLNMAETYGASVILAVGQKVPRWPECHTPEWVKTLDLQEQQAEKIEMLAELVRRYDNHKAVQAWQVENEPMLDFGECPPFSRDAFEQELTLVRSMSQKPIIVTDSGELNWWLDVAQYGDMVGTTMYRTVHSQRTNELFHYDYIFPAWLYRAKARLVNLVRGKDVFIAELQGEPWGETPFTQMPDQERQANISPHRLKEIHEFAQRTELAAAYWWGVEFWYWEKEAKGNSAYWETAKAFWNND